MEFNYKGTLTVNMIDLFDQQIHEYVENVLKNNKKTISRLSIAVIIMGSKIIRFILITTIIQWIIKFIFLTICNLVKNNN